MHVDEKNLIDAITTNDIIKHKLEGIVNKVDIAADTPADRQLSVVVREVLELHEKLGKELNPETKA